jgi:hypothetical protein
MQDISCVVSYSIGWLAVIQLAQASQLGNSEFIVDPDRSADLYTV